MKKFLFFFLICLTLVPFGTTALSKYDDIEVPIYLPYKNTERRTLYGNFFFMSQISYYKWVHFQKTRNGVVELNTEEKSDIVGKRNIKTFRLRETGDEIIVYSCKIKRDQHEGKKSAIYSVGLNVSELVFSKSELNTKQPVYHSLLKAILKSKRKQGKARILSMSIRPNLEFTARVEVY